MALESFDFTTTNGDRLDLIGSLTSHQDEIQTGAVEKRVVRRDGALHQFVGAPPRQYSFSCVIAGRDAQQRYERLCAVIRFAPEGIRGAGELRRNGQRDHSGRRLLARPGAERAARESGLHGWGTLTSAAIILDTVAASSYTSPKRSIT